MLSDGDREVIPVAFRKNGGFHKATEWFLQGFTPLPWQYAYHQLVLPSVSLKAGVAAGKTAIETASALIDCITIPHYKFLNTSVTAKQAELAFDMFMGWYQGNEKLERLVTDIRLRPWPVVTFYNYSVFECRTAGSDGRFLRGIEADRIGFDECGLDQNGEIVKILRSRLRGKRPDGSHRMGRLDCYSSPTDAPWWIARFEKGVKGTDVYNPRYMSFKVRTYDNTNLTEEQIRSMEDELTDEDRRVEMDAEDPDYGMSLFPKGHIRACTNGRLNDIMSTAINPGLEDENSKAGSKPGYVLDEHPRYGILHYETPYDPNKLYVMAGDPGQDDPPKRNSGCIGVAEAQSGRLVYFDWIAGHGSYNPFINSFKYALRKYRPSIKLLDTTGTQVGIQEIAFTNFGLETDGFNFSHGKDIALNNLSHSITNHEIEWPIIKGLLKQVSSYSRENDKKDDFPQDIVMMLAMLSVAIQNAKGTEDQGGGQLARPVRLVRAPRRRRR